MRHGVFIIFPVSVVTAVGGDYRQLHLGGGRLASGATLASAAGSAGTAGLFSSSAAGQQAKRQNEGKCQGEKFLLVHSRTPPSFFNLPIFSFVQYHHTPFRVLSIRIEKKVAYSFEVTVSD